MTEDEPSQLSLALGGSSGRQAGPPGAPTPSGGRVRRAGAPLVVVGAGPREVEGELIAQLEAHARAVASDPARLARPLRIIVPSRSLRDHVAGAALRALGRPLVGVSIETLFAAALGILERGGEAAVGGRTFFGVLVQRLARDEPAFSSVLSDFDSVHGVAERAVSDLLDAGFAPEHAEPLVHLLAECEQDGIEASHAAATAKVALRAQAELERCGFAHRSQLLLRAASMVRDDAALLPAAAIVVHGFAEATGAATDLLAALASVHPTTLLMDAPLEPGHHADIDPGAVFTQRLRERFAGLGESVAKVAAPGAVLRRPERVELVRAPGCQAEVRAVAGRIRALLEGGARAEGIGVVVRQLASHALALRAHFERLGIPYSGVGGRVRAGSAARRAGALGELLRRGEDCAADRWVGTLAKLFGAEPIDVHRGERADLQLGLRHLGAARLRDVAELDPGEEDLVLPARVGLRVSDSGGDSGGDSQSGAADDGEDSEANESDDEAPVLTGPFARRRRLPIHVLRAAVEAARRLRTRLAEWPAHAPVRDHVERLRELLLRDLGWPEADWQAMALEALETDLPAGFVLAREELARIVLERLETGEAEVPIGGRGAGVAVLGVMEARARTFEHLFVLGLNRDVFPRAVREDPLLSDELRRRLSALLPDLPIKATAHDEERYLFAQLYAASPDVVLVWQSANDDGKQRVASTLVDRLRADLEAEHDSERQRQSNVGPEPPPEVIEAPGLHAAGLLAAPGPCTARERAVVAGANGRPSDHAALVPLALRERGRADAALAASRLAVVRELARHPEEAAGLGPYFGFLGPVREKHDLRLADRYVTTLERMALCPWRVALEKLLRVEATPDPLETLPQIDPRLVGSAVHDALEQIFGAPKLSPSAADPQSESRSRSDSRDSRTGRRGEGSELRALTEQAARAASGEVARDCWPAASELRQLELASSRAALAEHGGRLEGLVHVLADTVHAHLLRVRELDEREPGELVVLGAEVAGTLEIQDGDAMHALRFRADRVERAGETLVLTDFKTGRKPVSIGTRVETRRNHFAQAVARGRLLQAVTYALASGGPSDRGRYLFVNPEVDVELAEHSFSVGDADALPLRRGFEEAVRTLGRAWVAGVFAPRLSRVEDDVQPPPCRYCEVRDACLQGDTGLRQRQRRWIERAGAPDWRGTAAEQEYLALWRLAAAVPPSPDSGSGEGAT